MKRRRPGTLVAIAALTSAADLLTSTAGADDSAPPLPAATQSAIESLAPPPPSGHAYVQYGVALAAETVVSSGAICSLVTNCIFGSGGGLVVRVGWRPNENFFIGGTYEVSKQDPDQLYRLGILQQLRAEGRRYFTTGREVTPFLLLGAGVGAYGNEWTADTWGPTGTVGGGIEVELGGPVLLVEAAYRPMYFHSWEVSNNELQSGFVHFVSLDIAVEAKDRL
ncbi:MAG TPA: hypothetical protein VGL81_09210 [Polyangiaceae bacterium]|jgi:hypothetical protein